MKLDTLIIMSKGAAYLVGGIFGPWAAALGQWVIDGTFPPLIVWIGLILPLSVLGGANAWLAFCSGSWKEYLDQQRADNSKKPVITEIKPTPPLVPLQQREKEAEKNRRTPPNQAAADGFGPSSGTTANLPPGSAGGLEKIKP